MSFNKMLLLIILEYTTSTLSLMPITYTTYAIYNFIKLVKNFSITFSRFSPT